MIIWSRMEVMWRGTLSNSGVNLLARWFQVWVVRGCGLLKGFNSLKFIWKMEVRPHSVRKSWSKPFCSVCYRLQRTNKSFQPEFLRCTCAFRTSGNGRKHHVGQTFYGLLKSRGVKWRSTLHQTKWPYSAYFTCTRIFSLNLTASH